MKKLNLSIGWMVLMMLFFSTLLPLHIGTTDGNTIKSSVGDISINDPEIKWKYETRAAYCPPWSVPNNLIVTDDSIYTLTTEKSVVLSLSFEGEKKWVYGEGMEGDYLSNINYNEEKIYMVIDDQLHIFDKQGEKVEVLDREVTSFSVDKNGSIYSIIDGDLYSISEDLKTRWKFSGNFFSQIAYDEDNIYLSSSTKFYSINKDGSSDWNYNISSPPLMTFKNCIKVVSDSVYFVDDDGGLSKFDKSGDMIWSIDLGKGAPPVSIDEEGKIYSIKRENHERKLVCINKDGTISWEKDLGDYGPDRGYEYPYDEDTLSCFEPLITDDDVIVGIANKLICIGRADREIKWSMDWDKPGQIESSPTLGEDDIYVRVSGNVYRIGEKDTEETPSYTLPGTMILLVGIAIIYQIIIGNRGDQLERRSGE